jgi:hypothetical protein
MDLQWHTTLRRRLHLFLAPIPKPKPPIDPALLKHEQERAEARQNRFADRITTFAGSMLLDLSRQILELTKEVRTLADRGDALTRTERSGRT